MKALTDPTDPSIWQQKAEEPYELQTWARSLDEREYSLVQGVWRRGRGEQHQPANTLARIVIRWGTHPYLERFHEGPFPPWNYDLVTDLVAILGKSPKFDKDNVGNAMVLLGSVLGFPCVEVRTEINRARWPTVPCVVASDKKFDRFITIESKRGPPNPYTVELGGEPCYICERSGTVLVVRTSDFDFNSTTALARTGPDQHG